MGIINIGMSCVRYQKYWAQKYWNVMCQVSEISGISSSSCTSSCAFMGGCTGTGSPASMGGCTGTGSPASVGGCTGTSSYASIVGHMGKFEEKKLGKKCWKEKNVREKKIWDFFFEKNIF